MTSEREREGNILIATRNLTGPTGKGLDCSAASLTCPGLQLRHLYTEQMKKICNIAAAQLELTNCIRTVNLFQKVQTCFHISRAFYGPKIRSFSFPNQKCCNRKIRPNKNRWRFELCDDLFVDTHTSSLISSSWLTILIRRLFPFSFISPECSSIKHRNGAISSNFLLLFSFLNLFPKLWSTLYLPIVKCEVEDLINGFSPLS